MSKTYSVNEVFYSIQGEGMRAGTANVFVRFAGCNLQCSQETGPKSPGGFDCDTEFSAGRAVTAEELTNWIDVAIDIALDKPQGEGRKIFARDPWIIFTGGEPGLQVDLALCEHFHRLGWKLAIETNGSVALPQYDGHTMQSAVNLAADEGLGTALQDFALDWITVSPKVAEHAVKQLVAHEVKYVRGYGQPLPKTAVRAHHKLISPAFDGLRVDPRTVEWCNKLVLDDPTWRLSVQMHKLWKVR